uniref:Uncharacterized protein n=1 Tax=Anguilla anguilla TaxID=7936 RepID=A0A0E9W2S8_ANGAN
MGNCKYSAAFLKLLNVSNYIR